MPKRLKFLLFFTLLTSFLSFPIRQFRAEAEEGKTRGLLGEELIKNLESKERFTRYEIGTRLVYFEQRKIGEAVVEKEFINYQFDKGTNVLEKKVVRWRDGLPSQLPVFRVTKQQAEDMVDGEALFSTLYMISPDSDVFPLDPVPQDPCWVIGSSENNITVLTIINAVTGENLGQGVPPPSKGYSLTGPKYFRPCWGSWTSWSENARDWFEKMGYVTEGFVSPWKSSVLQHIEDPETKLFYELAHGDSSSFINGCASGGGEAFSWRDVETGLSARDKVPFAFIGSCGGMCATGSSTLSHAFRKGSVDECATVGFCGMAAAACEGCFPLSVDWQDQLFGYMYHGDAVKEAFNRALADYPVCDGCMRFAGDENYTLPVPGVTAYFTYPPPNLTTGGSIYLEGTAQVPEGETFESYSIDFAPKGSDDWSTAGITLLNNNGTAAVNENRLAIWDMRPLSAGTYVVRLQVFGGSLPAIGLRSVSVEPSMKNLRLGWPVPVNGLFMSAVVVGDVNGDGSSEIVFHVGNNVHVYQDDGNLSQLLGAVPAYATKWDESHRIKSIYPVLGDVDDNYPGKEIVAQYNESQVIAWHGDGSVVPGWPVNVGLVGSNSGPVLDDLDENGSLEVIVPAYRGETLIDSEKLYVFDGSGSELWSEDVFAKYFPGDYRLESGHRASYAVLTGDINGNGKKEIILRFWCNSFQITKLMALDGITGAPASGWESGPLEIPFAIEDNWHMVLGDVDGIDGYEIIGASHSTHGVTDTVIVRGDGTMLGGWDPKQVPFSNCSRAGGADRAAQILLTDLTNDNIPEIVYFGREGCIAAVDVSTGELVSGFDDSLGTMMSYAVSGDLDNDNTREFLSNGFVGERGNADPGFTLSSYNAEDVTLEQVDAVYLCRGVCSEWGTHDAAFSDLDGDSKVEIIIPHDNFVYVFDTSATGGFLDWPQYLHDAGHTGAWTPSGDVPKRGDLDNDGDVDSDDLKILLENFYTAIFDLNSDGVVNGIDFGELLGLIESD